MHVVLTPSPSITHRFRITLPSHRTIDFGREGVKYYIDHGNPRLMRAQLLRKGAIIPKKLRIERDQYEIHREMLKITESSKEDWEDYFRADFWERWMLYTYSDVNKSKLFMTMNKGVLFVPTLQDIWNCENNITLL